MKIEGVIFDLDGTLLDSTWVWSQIDTDFLKKRGFEVPEDYSTAIMADVYKRQVLRCRMEPERQPLQKHFHHELSMWELRKNMRLPLRQDLQQAV